MLFGLAISLATFMTLMNSLFHKYLDKLVAMAIDDILNFSKMIEHKDHLRQVFDIFRSNKLFAKLRKCDFFHHILSSLVI